MVVKKLAGLGLPTLKSGVGACIRQLVSIGEHILIKKKCAVHHRIKRSARYKGYTPMDSKTLCNGATASKIRTRTERKTCINGPNRRYLVSS